MSFSLRNKSKKSSVFLHLKKMTKIVTFMGTFGLAKLYNIWIYMVMYGDVFVYCIFIVHIVHIKNKTVMT